MNTPQPISPRRRMQELQAIPDSQRTDAEWDELHELEIMLAPGNQAGGPEPRAMRNAPYPSSGPKPHRGMPNKSGGGGGGGGGGMANKRSGPPRQHGAGQAGNAGNPNAAPRPEGAPAPQGQGKKPPKKFHKRPPKGNAPQAGGAPAGGSAPAAASAPPASPPPPKGDDAS